MDYNRLIWDDFGKDYSMNYKVAVFDMDGTILNTLEDLADTMNYSLRTHQMPERTLFEVRSFVGNGIRKLVERAVPDGTSEAEQEAVFHTFHEHYKDHCAIKTRPYDGICEVIGKLRDAGVKTAVVSNKADYAVKSLCEDYFKGLFDYSVGDKEGQRIKPYPDGVFDVQHFFDVEQKDMIYIGDSEVDFQTAQNAGIDVIMVGWGFRDAEYLKKFGVNEMIYEPEKIVSMILD